MLSTKQGMEKEIAKELKNIKDGVGKDIKSWKDWVKKESTEKEKEQ